MKRILTFGLFRVALFPYGAPSTAKEIIHVHGCGPGKIEVDGDGPDDWDCVDPNDGTGHGGGDDLPGGPHGDPSGGGSAGGGGGGGKTTRPPHDPNAKAKALKKARCQKCKS